MCSGVAHELGDLHQMGMDNNYSTGLTHGSGQGKETWHDVPYLVLLLPLKA